MTEGAGPAPGDGLGERLSRAAAVAALQHTLAHGGARLAAALTYYATLSLAPALIVLVSLVGLLGGHAEARVETVLDAVGEVAPGAVVQALEGPVTSVARGDDAGAFLRVGLAVALWAASGYVGAFSWTAELACGVSRHEGFRRRAPRQFAIAAATLVAWRR
jgi:membrane protein